MRPPAWDHFSDVGVTKRKKNLVASEWPLVSYTWDQLHKITWL